MDCHKPDPHNGQFAKRPGGGECASCHTVDGWKPSTFTVKEHASSAYPLEGKHCAAGMRQVSHSQRQGHAVQDQVRALHRLPQGRARGQFAAAPYLNACDRCHNLEGYKPSTFTLARHKETHFVLTGGHVAVPCADCHKESADAQAQAGGDLSLEGSDLHELPRRSAQGPVQRTHAAGAEPTELPPAAKLATPPNRGRSCRASTTRRHRSRWWGAPGHRLHRLPQAAQPGDQADQRGLHSCAHQVRGLPRGCSRQAVRQGRRHPLRRCHNSTKWKPALFDHDKRTAFPLRGLHQNVRCAECHKLTKWSRVRLCSSTSLRPKNARPAMGRPRLTRSPEQRVSRNQSRICLDMYFR